MKHGIQNRWAVGVFIFLLVSTLPLSAFCEQASIRGVKAKGSNGAWKVSFVVENCFTENMNEAIQSGIKTAFTFYLEVYRKRKLWRDQKVVSMEFHHSIQFDPIQGQYSVTLEEHRSSRSTSDLEEAKKWMAKVEEVGVRPPSQLEPGIPTELRIKAELDPVKLPFHLEYLFFFVSLWDFETQWHVEPLLP
jgi:hypothetical protein